MLGGGCGTVGSETCVFPPPTRTPVKYTAPANSNVIVRRALHRKVDIEVMVVVRRSDEPRRANGRRANADLEPASQIPHAPR